MTDNIEAGRKAIVHDPSRVMEDNVLTQVLYTDITLTSSGDTIVVTGIANTIIKVLSFWLTTGAATTLQWKSGATAKSGSFPLATNGGVSVDSTWGILKTDAGDSLILNSDTTATIGGTLTYALL